MMGIFKWDKVNKQLNQTDQTSHAIRNGIGVLIDGVHFGGGGMGEGFLSY